MGRENLVKLEVSGAIDVREDRPDTDGRLSRSLSRVETKRAQWLLGRIGDPRPIPVMLAHLYLQY